MVTYLRRGKNVLLALALLGIGLGCGQTAAPESASEENSSAAPTSITAAQVDSPEAVAAAFIDLCLAGDIVTARSLLTEATRESVDTFAGGNPCGDFDSDVFRGLGRTLYENQVVGATAHITWEWPKQEDSRLVPRYAFVLAQENGAWRIMSGETAGVTATQVPTPVTPTPDYVNVSSDLALDAEASETTDFPIPAGCVLQPRLPTGIRCQVPLEVYPTKAVFDFYLYQMPRYGWELKYGSQLVPVYSETGELYRAQTQWSKDNREVVILITVSDVSFTDPDAPPYTFVAIDDVP